MIRTRIAPSPTGEDVHVGSIATALINYAWAKKNNGRFVIRIEDTDRSRLVPGAEEKMLTTLESIGIKADESPIVGGPYDPYRQSERLAIYQDYAKKLIDSGKAYYCTCTAERLAEMRKEQQAKKQIAKYDRHCLKNSEAVKKQIDGGSKYVVRLKIPDDKEIVVEDTIRGTITFYTKDIDDQVLLKSDGFPTYHLAVVVDDHLMKITNVIRGEEWLPSTPKHIILYQSFGWEPPIYTHVSLLRNPDRSKLSKRRNPVWASWYFSIGILPEALLNYLALMGWSHPKGKEIFSLTEYVEVFDIKDIQTTAPVFDPVKLEWMNGMYIRQSQKSELKSKILEFYKDKNLPEDLVEKTIPLIQDRIKKLSDYLPLCEFFFKRPEKFDIDLEDKKELINNIREELEKINDWKANIIGESMQNLVKKIGIKAGEFFMILRVIITGKKISPPLNESMEILGKEECLKRI